MTSSHRDAQAPWPRSEPSALTPGSEQAEIREAIRGVLAKYSTIEQVRAAADAAPGYSVDLWKRLVTDMSVTTLAVPEEAGGLGYGMVELGIILEECGRALAVEPVYQHAAVGVRAMMEAGNSNLLDEILDGRTVVAVSALTVESDDLEALRTGDGWAVSGQARFVVGGGGADLVVVSARAPEGAALFAVPTKSASAVRDRRVVDSTRRQADISFDRAPATLLVSVDGAGDAIARIQDVATLALACENTGIADALLQMTLDHVKTRHQFGRPIGSFQAIKHRLADLLIELERARSAARYAAAVHDEDPDDARLAIAVAGAVCGDAAVQVAHEAVQLHGGVGFTWEHAAHSYFRRVLGNEALQGDSRAHRARIADFLAV
ncbi:acyl-CoA dehydrogenase [Rhodococcus sp. 06-462-5]|uniref:acyl-CoA dehydrogenase family protein n=1 Tax=unclassified Rhodococcus (in: high G+C Gram-positive bacteria) TaxID=192944 RepID=UPI000B9A678F|nr:MULTISPECIES: acyl-CoA dehydrogenase family protein [unclassified Rhodococcus (in: high G+C Gram-positive bacteria)]OZC63794.1 acyl-CoA dehydrogenase [Rhodococcus sp. 06-462-5]OZE61549.1 acyl-CoA dehydrogenase [Rhodococcus sp. 02-925g]